MIRTRSDRRQLPVFWEEIARTRPARRARCAGSRRRSLGQDEIGQPRHNPSYVQKVRSARLPDHPQTHGTIQAKLPTGEYCDRRVGRWCWRRPEIFVGEGFPLDQSAWPTLTSSRKSIAPMRRDCVRARGGVATGPERAVQDLVPKHSLIPRHTGESISFLPRASAARSAECRIELP
jgi:hypothetical protein